MENERLARLLIVDDESGMREVLREFLAEYDYEILEAANGEVALRILDRERIDLAIVDIFMPEVDGIELLAELQARALPAKVIAMSGGGEAGSVGTPLRAAALLGAAATLEKPFDLHIMLSHIRQCLECA